jgi:hypothetical protein
MQNAKYSSGPKFFGTTVKSNCFIIKNLGLMKEIDVLQDQELIKSID